MDKTFTCCYCGELFTSMKPPAETRDDDPQPTCGPCLEKMLDDVDAEPLDEALLTILEEAESLEFDES